MLEVGLALGDEMGTELVGCCVGVLEVGLHVGDAAGTEDVAS